MVRKAQEFPVVLKVEYTPVPMDRVEAWRASLVVLLDLLHEEVEAQNEHKRLDRDRSGSGVRAPLFSLANVVKQEVAQAQRLHAWVVGHDGSAHCMAYGSRRD